MRRIRSLLVAAVAAAIAGCGADASPADGGATTDVSPPRTAAANTTAASAPPTPTTLAAAADLVVSERPMTDADWQALSGDDGTSPLDCDVLGGSSHWDYGEISPSEPTGREPHDALRDAIDSMNRDLGAELPYEGWRGLVASSGDITYVEVGAAGGWTSLVKVGGDPEAGVWRHFEGFVCAGNRDDVVARPVVAGRSPALSGFELQLYFPPTPRWSTGHPIRGVGWTLQARSGDGWDEPDFILVAAADSYECPDCPRWHRIDDDGWGYGDVGVSGPGPDTVLLPPALPPGPYRLCTDNAPEQLCVELTVE